MDYDDWKTEVVRLAILAGCRVSAWWIYDERMMPAHRAGLSPTAYVTTEGQRHGETILRGGPGQEEIIPQGCGPYTGDM